MKKKKPPKTIETGLRRLGGDWIITILAHSPKAARQLYAVENVTANGNSNMYFQTTILGAVREACRKEGL